MAKAAGRDAIFKKASTAIGGVRVVNLSMNGTPIDVSDRDSSGFREILTGTTDWQDRSLTFSVEGIHDDETLRDIAVNPAASLYLTDLEFEFASGDTITGNFWMDNYDEGNNYREATTFTAAFSNAGTWTRTAA